MKQDLPEVHIFTSITHFYAKRSAVLTALRNQLTLHYNETTPGPEDERVLLAKLWMEASPGAQELFNLWGTINQVRIPYRFKFLVADPS